MNKWKIQLVVNFRYTANTPFGVLRPVKKVSENQEISYNWTFGEFLELLCIYFLEILAKRR